VVDVPSFPPPASKADFGLEDAAAVFLFAFDANSSIERKNPEAAVEAFSRAFGTDRDVLLLMKVSNASRLPHRARLRDLTALVARRGANVRFLFEDYTSEEMLRLISAADAYLSLHRAEGFGYTCAEAMAYGKPVVATNYSGNLDYMSPDNSYLVDCRETTVKVADGPFQRGSVWAEPDVEHAAQLLRQVALDPRQASERGQRARETVLATLSAGAVGTLVADALPEADREIGDALAQRT
jgi:glycosyltransferase involved in cell wall biosynthesis